MSNASSSEDASSSMAPFRVWMREAPSSSLLTSPRLAQSTSAGPAIIIWALFLTMTE